MSSKPTITPEEQQALLKQKALNEGLFYAIMRRDIDKVTTSLKAGADVNAKDKNGFTPLHYAADQDLKDIAATLIKKGANVHAKIEGVNLLEYASKYKHKEVFELLKAHDIKEAAHVIKVRIEQFEEDIKTPTRSDIDLIQDIAKIKTVLTQINQPELASGIGAHLRSLTQTTGGRQLRKGFGFRDTRPREFQDKLDLFFSENGIVADPTLPASFSVPSAGRKIEVADPFARKESDASSVSAGESLKLTESNVDKMRTSFTVFKPSQTSLAKLGDAKPRDKGAGAGIS